MFRMLRKVRSTILLINDQNSPSGSKNYFTQNAKKAPSLKYFDCSEYYSTEKAWNISNGLNAHDMEYYFT